MLWMHIYPFYYYIALAIIGIPALFFSQNEMSVQKNIGDE